MVVPLYETGLGLSRFNKYTALMCCMFWITIPLSLLVECTNCILQRRHLDGDKAHTKFVWS